MLVEFKCQFVIIFSIRLMLIKKPEINKIKNKNRLHNKIQNKKVLLARKALEKKSKTITQV